MMDILTAAPFLDAFPHRTVNMSESSILSTWRVSGFLMAQWLSRYRVTLKKKKKKKK